MFFYISLVYASTALVLCALAHISGRRDVATLKAFIITGIFCMWLSFALIYIAQIYPLILPTRVMHE